MTTYTAEQQLRADTWNVAWRAKNWYRAWQNVSEFAEVLNMVAQHSPLHVVVEIGAAWGGTLYAWRHLPWRTPPDVYAITMDHFGPMIDTHGAVVIKGDSHDRATLDVLRAGLGGRPVDVLFIDGDHTAEGLRSDWLMYSPLVRPGGLVLIHDIRCAGEEPVREVWETEIKPEADATGSHTQEIYAKTGKPLGFGIVRMAGER